MKEIGTTELSPTKKIGFRSTRRYFKVTFIVSIIVLLFFIWFLNVRGPELFGRDNDGDSVRTTKLTAEHHVNRFSNNVLSYEKLRRTCYSEKDPESIEDLSVFVAMLRSTGNWLCRHQYNIFKYIYQIRVKYTTIVITEPFMQKIKRWLNNDKTLINAARNQSLIFVDNLYSSESVVFNPVRSNRPGVVGGNTLKYIKNLVKASSEKCDFCMYANNTASDSFGRMESKYAAIVSNAFKIEKYHGLALLKSHDPLYFTQLQFVDCMALVMKWFRRTNRMSPNHLYRVMYWDVLPKASASQIHPHLHLTLGDSSYYAKWNQLYKAGLKFAGEHNRMNYWTTLLQIHTVLGLTIKFQRASLMVYLTPQKDFEVIVISEKPCLDFFRLTFFTIRAFFDELNQFAVSMGFVFPKLDSDTTYGDELPMLMRIVSRGPADSPRTDISSFDLFGTPNVNKDPFKIIKKIKVSIEKSKREKFVYPHWKESD